MGRRIVSLTGVRERIRSATHGALVEEATIQAFSRELEGCFEALLTRTVLRYEAELMARKFHGLYPQPRVRPDHIRPASGILNASEIPCGNRAGSVPSQEVKHEKNAPEVA